ncbi:MAG: hypothetical protein ACRDN9_04780 [Streptosporangiaceae bacterium]
MPADDVPVLLTIVCERRNHVMGWVCDDPVDGPVVEVRRYARGRYRRSWVPARFVLRRGSGRRYGCPCGHSDLFDDQRLAEIVDAGYTVWVMPASKVSRRRPS